MKTKQTNKALVSEPSKGISITELPTKDQVTDAFRTNVKKRRKDNGSNNADNYIDSFLMAVARCSELGPFSLYDVIRETKPMDLPVEKVKELFGIYTETLTRLNVLTRIPPAVYDYEQFLRVN